MCLHNTCSYLEYGVFMLLLYDSEVSLKGLKIDRFGEWTEKEWKSRQCPKKLWNTFRKPREPLLQITLKNTKYDRIDRIGKYEEMRSDTRLFHRFKFKFKSVIYLHPCIIVSQYEMRIITRSLTLRSQLDTLVCQNIFSKLFSKFKNTDFFSFPFDKDLCVTM